MRIGEVEQLTGLSKKTIRLYEERGLIRGVIRSENSYREYSDEMISQLNTIALLRRAGISLSDIQLWQDEVISTSEMLKKRLAELKNTAVIAGDQVKLCRRLLDGLHGDRLPDDILSEEHEASDVAIEDTDSMADVTDSSVLTVGIDIGTTTISAVVLDISAGCPAGVYTVTNNAAVQGDEPYEKTQDIKKITWRVKKLLDALLNRFPTTRAIGFSGQMHGIVYLDAVAKPISELYTWQDGRAGIPDCDGKSVCDEIFEKTGYRISAGYGLATHAWMEKHGKVPKNAEYLCTVMDCIPAMICGCVPVMHSSNAASLGFFDVKNMKFDKDALRTAGVSAGLLPELTDRDTVIGSYMGIPVSVAIGDNQASVLGSIGENRDAILANFGTGSQISVICGREVIDEFTPTPDIEVRPFLDDSVLLSGSALCGGRAYAAMERFFRAYAEACGMADSEQYEVMNKLAERGMKKYGYGSSDRLRVRTAFCGTRSDSTVRGSVGNIGEENFSPEALLSATLYGMAEELFGLYGEMKKGKPSSRPMLVVSGNAVRKNKALKEAIGSVFGIEPKLPMHHEEAAYGAAIFAARTALTESEASDIEKCIRYK